MCGLVPTGAIEVQLNPFKNDSCYLHLGIWVGTGLSLCLLIKTKERRFALDVSFLVRLINGGVDSPTLFR